MHSLNYGDALFIVIFVDLKSSCLRRIDVQDLEVEKLFWSFSVITESFWVIDVVVRVDVSELDDLDDLKRF